MGLEELPSRAQTQQKMVVWVVPECQSLASQELGTGSLQQVSWVEVMQVQSMGWVDRVGGVEDMGWEEVVDWGLEVGRESPSPPCIAMAFWQRPQPHSSAHPSPSSVI